MSDFNNEINHIESQGGEQSESNSAEDRANTDDVDLSMLTGFEMAQCEGEPDLIVELIDLYLANVPQQLSAMKDFVSKADKASLKRAAHNLKGSSANMGAQSVAAICLELEHADADESFEQSSVLINRLEQTFEHIRPIFLAERQSRIYATKRA